MKLKRLLFIILILLVGSCIALVLKQTKSYISKYDHNAAACVALFKLSEKTKTDFSKFGIDIGACFAVAELSEQIKSDISKQGYDIYNAYKLNEVYTNYDAYVLVRKDNKKYLFYAKQSEPEVHEIEKLSEIDDFVKFPGSDRPKIKINGKCGLYSSDKLALDVIYDDIYPAKQYEDNYYIMKKNNKYGLLSCSMSDCLILAPVEYDNIKFLGYKHFLAQKGNKAALFANEKQLTGFVFDKDINSIDTAINNHYVVIDNELFYKDIKISKFDSVEIRDKYAIVKLKNKYGLYHEGKLECLLNYDKIYFGKGAIILSKGNKTMFLSDKILYDKIEESGDYYKVYKNSKVGLYSYGKLYVPCEYDDIEPCPMGHIVTKNNKKGIIQYSKKIPPDIIYDDIKVVNKKGFIVAKNKKFGFYHWYRGIVVPVEYDSISFRKDTNELELKKGNNVSVVKL